MQISKAVPTCRWRCSPAVSKMRNARNLFARMPTEDAIVGQSLCIFDGSSWQMQSFHKSCAFQIGIVHREKEKTNSRRKQGEFSFKFKYFARHVNSPNPTKKSLLRFVFQRWSFDAMLFLTPTHHNSLVIFDFNSTSFANVESSVTWVLKAHSISQKKTKVPF